MFPIDFFYRAAQEYPHRIALDSPDEQYTYARLHAEVTALASAMQALDASPQSRVAICAANSAAHIVALLAVLASGKIWVPLNYRNSAAEISRVVDATEPSIVVVDASGDALVLTQSPYRIVLDGDGSDAIRDGKKGQPNHTRLALAALLARYAGQTPLVHELSRDDTQAIKFTGGTTGLPKGVMQPYRAWCAVIVNQIAGWGLTETDRYVVTAPVTHGTSTYLLPVLAQGGALVLLDTASPASITAAFRERGGTLTFMPPTLIYMLMAQPGVSRTDFPMLRNLIYGGAPMPAEKIAQVRDFFGPVLGTTYGQTEAPQIVTLMRPADFAEPSRHGSVGRVSWHSNIAIVAPDGRKLGPGELGEVIVSGDLVMTGYWRLPELTAQTLINDCLHTGDVGVLDERGYLYLKDRLRDVVITGGFNVYPVDVENALSQHPAVYECSVYGVPDDKWGEAVQAAVQLHDGAAATEEELMAFVKHKLGSVQTPKRINLCPSLPRSSVGKVLKKAVRDAAMEETS